MNFGIPYGISEFRLAREMGISMEEASRYVSRYFGRFPKVRAYVESMPQQARRWLRANPVWAPPAPAGAEGAGPCAARGGGADGDQHPDAGNGGPHHQAGDAAGARRTATAAADRGG